MRAIDALAKEFSRLPGIGARQARRLVYHLLSREPGYLEALARLLEGLAAERAQCASCKRFFEGKGELCDLCRDLEREGTTLMVLEKDIDLEAMEKSGVFHGRYFLLGGLIPILEKNPSERIRIKELVGGLAKRKGFKEVIIALSANVEGDNTALYVAKTLEPLAKKNGFKVTRLGRGLSTGTELEYSDQETLRSALGNRK